MSLKTSTPSPQTAGEKLVELPAPDRRCTRCGDLDQSRPVSIYSPDQACCPVCRNPEFEPLYTPEWKAYLKAMEAKTKPAAKTTKPKVAPKSGNPEEWLATKGQAESAPKPTGNGPEFVMINLKYLMEDPKNPRTILPDEPGLLEIVDTAKRCGILEPLLVRPHASLPEMFLIMAGHRRFAAAVLANLKTVPCLVHHNATDATATEIRIIENLQREDLNAIETARELRAAMVDLNLSQDGLATRFKKSQAWVSHHLRLLKLPDFLQDEIDEGRLNKTQGRQLAVFADVTAVMDEFVLAYRNCEWDGDEEADESISHESFARCFESAIETGTRPITPGWRVPFNPTPEQLKLLDVRETVIEGDRERVAVNVELWEQLREEELQARKAESIKRNKEQKKARAEQAKERAKGQANDAPKSAPGDQRDEGDEDDETPEQDQETDTDVAEDNGESSEEIEGKILNAKVFRYYVTKLQSLLLERAGELTVRELLQWAVGMAASGTGVSSAIREGVADGIAAYSKRTKEPITASNSWVKVMELDMNELEGTVRQWFKAWCRLPIKSWATDATPGAIIATATMLEILLKDWQLDREFFMLHSIEQLHKIVAEWQLTPVAGMGKTELVNYLLKNHAGKPLPLSLKNVSPVEL